MVAEKLKRGGGRHIKLFLGYFERREESREFALFLLQLLCSLRFCWGPRQQEECRRKNGERKRINLWRLDNTRTNTH